MREATIKFLGLKRNMTKFIFRAGINLNNWGWDKFQSLQNTTEPTVLAEIIVPEGRYNFVKTDFNLLPRA